MNNESDKKKNKQLEYSEKKTAHNVAMRQRQVMMMLLHLRLWLYKKKTRTPIRKKISVTTPNLTILKYIQSTPSLKTLDPIFGGCVLIPEHNEPISQKKTNAYLRQVSTDSELGKEGKHFPKHFRFKIPNHRCLGKFNLRMPVGEEVVMIFDAYVVPIDVPLLLGIDVLQKVKLLIIFEDGTLLSPCKNGSGNLVSKIWHVYVEWPAKVYYTDTELCRIHRQFHHPPTKKLANLIQRGAPEHVNPALRKNIDHARDKCDTCKRLAKEPIGFRVHFFQKIVYSTEPSAWT